MKTNPDADFVLQPDDLVAIIGSGGERQRFCRLASAVACNDMAEKDMEEKDG